MAIVFVALALDKPMAPPLPPMILLEPFVFDIEGEMYEYRSRTHRMVEQFPPPGKHGDWQLLLHKMVSSYLIHQGFSSTAEAFARTAGQDIDEDITSIQNRQAIQKLVLAGRMGDAITMTNRLYPGFLQRHPSLHFMLKVRQFIEMVSGNDTTESDVLGQGSRSNIPGSIQISSEGMERIIDDAMMDSQAEGHVFEVSKNQVKE